MAFCKCNKPIVQIFVVSGRIPGCRPIGAGLSLSKIPFGAFRQGFAVCRAHSLCAAGAQLAHLQPDRYFLPGTRPGRKWVSFSLPLLRQILRSFFLHAGPPLHWGGGSCPYWPQMFNFHKSPAMPRSQFKHIFFIFLLKFGAERGILTQINTKKEGCRNILVLRPSFFV